MKKQTALIVRISLLLALIGAAVGLFYTKQYATRRTADIETLAELRTLQAGLDIYYRNRASFPPGSAPLSLGAGGVSCLSIDGFASSCPAGSAYATIRSGPYEYRALSSGGSPCDSSVGCPRYEVIFQLSTNAVYPKGERKLTPEGIF